MSDGVGLGGGGGSWWLDSQNFGCVRYALKSSTNDLKCVLTVVAVDRRCPNVATAVPLTPSSPSPALQQLLVPLRALSYILPWFSNRE